MVDSFLARQPILDQKSQVFGYELLFRSGSENFFSSPNPEFASASVINDSLHLYGLDKLLNGTRCFINFTRKSLLDELYTVLPASQTVIEVLETVIVDDAVVRACRKARDRGYTVALDDYVPNRGFETLLPFVDLIKVEFPALSDPQHAAVLATSRQYGLDLIAEKVELPQDFDKAVELGYQYFQGYFFCRPQMLRARRLPCTLIQQLRLLRLVNDPDFHVDEIERLIRQDVALSYKLLRYLNSPLFQLKNKVESIRHAVTIIGQLHLKQWVLLLTVGDLSTQKPLELMNTCLIRAKFCESIAEQCPGAASADECFVIGLLSLLDAILDQPMEEVVGELALSDNIRDTLLRQNAPQRRLLDLAVAFERGDWNTIGQVIRELSAREESIFTAYRRSVVWANEILKHTHETTDSD